MCEVKGLREDCLKEQLAKFLGMEEWNDAVFQEKVKQINVDGYFLEIIFNNGEKTTMTFKSPTQSRYCSEEQKEHMRQLMKKR